jgi:homoserine kinase
MKALPNTNFSTGVRIRIPASASNLGAAFDAVGFALQLYLTIEYFQSGCFFVGPIGCSIQSADFGIQHASFIPNLVS